MNKVTTDTDAIYKFMNNTRGPVARDMRRRGRNVKAYAKNIVAVDTGRLKKSIDSRLLEDGHGIYVEVGSEVEYAIYVEYEVNGNHSFLRPALKAARD